MKPWKSWLARLGIAGACLLVTGCGGGDIPDASDDGQAATETAPAAGAGGGAAPAAVEEPKVAQAEPPPGAEEAPAAATAPTQTPEPETPAETPAVAEAPGKSSTAEMLAIATGSSAGANAPGGDSATPAANASAGPGAPGPGAMQGRGGPGGMMMAGAPGGMQAGRMGGSGMPGSAMTGQGDMAARMRAAGMNPGGASGPGGMGGMSAMGGPGGMGGRGGPGGIGGDNKPPDFRSPQGAVKAFLAALKAKDLDRLNESTALRAQQEAASSKSRDLFRKIFDLSLSESELDELAEKLEGYTISGENPARSTGRAEVILRKTGKNNAYALRKVTVRHEKKGWGVMDVAGEMEFKSIGASRNNTGTAGGRR